MRLANLAGDLRRANRPRDAHEIYVRIRVSNSLLERISMKNAFVFTVLGAGPLGWEEVVYLRDGNTDEGPAGKHGWVGGRDFYVFHYTDYAFVDPPERIEIETPREVRSTLFRATGDPAEVVAAAVAGEEGLEEVDVRALAECQLKGGNRDGALVDAYLAWCEGHTCREPARKLIAELGLAAPVPAGP
jgi:hypothetical protein